MKGLGISREMFFERLIHVFVMTRWFHKLQGYIENDSLHRLGRHLKQFGDRLIGAFDDG